MQASSERCTGGIALRADTTWQLRSRTRGYPHSLCPCTRTQIFAISVTDVASRRSNSSIYFPNAVSDAMSIAEAYHLSDEDVTRLIGMVWEDDIPFEAIEAQYGVPEDDVITLMRRHLKPSSWRLWRERVGGRPTKHAAKRRQMSRFPARNWQPTTRCIATFHI